MRQFFCTSSLLVSL
ncbi:unnamed protein product [Debaryomyces tyrocola]|nr:unnamed protein product [Debaryomyces tyrocola]